MYSLDVHFFDIQKGTCVLLSEKCYPTSCHTKAFGNKKSLPLSAMKKAAEDIISAAFSIMWRIKLVSIGPEFIHIRILNYVK